MITEIPKQIAALPVDKRGLPIPFFVQWYRGSFRTSAGNGEPDHRLADPDKKVRCAERKLCWICGEPLGYWIAFVGSKQSIDQRLFGDGAMHVECAEFSMRACPHLSHPQAKRRDNDERKTTAVGKREMHNPGTFGMYVTRSFDTQYSDGDILFKPAPPKKVRWFQEGQEL